MAWSSFSLIHHTGQMMGTNNMKPLVAAFLIFLAGIAFAAPRPPVVGVVRSSDPHNLMFYTADSHLRKGDKLLILSTGKDRNIACCIVISGGVGKTKDKESIFVALNDQGAAEDIYAYSAFYSSGGIATGYGPAIAIAATAIAITPNGYRLTLFDNRAYELNTCLGIEGINIYLSDLRHPALHYYVPLGYDVEEADCK